MKNFLQVNRALAAEKNFTKLESNLSGMAWNLHVIERRFSSTDRLSDSCSERSLTSEEASIQHPLSIHSASIEHPLGVGGNLTATRSLFRIWKYAAMITLLLTFACGQAWGAASTSSDGAYASGTITFASIGTISTNTNYWYNGVKIACTSSQSASASNSAWSEDVSVPVYISSKTAGKDANKGKWGSSGSGKQYTMSGFACNNHTLGIHVNQACTITIVVNRNLGSDTDNAGIAASIDATAYGTGWTFSSTNTWKVAGTSLTVTSSRTDATNKPGRYTLTIPVTAGNLTNGEAVVKIFHDGSGTGAGKLYCYESITVAAGCTAPNHVDISGNWDYFGGETISLTATPYSSAGTGSPITSGITGYQWQKLISSTWTDVEDGTDEGTTISGATTANLQIAGCTGEHSGKYRCTISTGATCSTSSATATDGTEGFQVKVFTLECYTGGTTVYHFTRIGETQTGSTTITLAASTGYQFKFHIDGTYYGNSGTINEDVSNWVCTSGAGNLTINSGLGGTFTITMDYSDGCSSSTVGEPEISVTYPRKTIYLNAGGSDLWDKDNAKFGIYYFRKESETLYGHAWTDIMPAYACGSGIYVTEIPQWNGVKINAVRLNPSATNNNKSDWWDDYKYNQTNDCPVSSNDYITITGWNEPDYTYTTYDAPEYTISFGGNGETSGSMTDVEDIECDASVTLEANAFVKTGYTFTGWKDGSSNDYADEATISNITADIALTAQWSAKQCTVSFNTNGGSGTITSVTATYDAAMPTKAGNLPTKTGYDFGGFYDDEDCTGTKYYNADGSSAQNWDKNTTSNTTLYAKWTAHVYTVTLDLEGGSGTTSVTATYNAILSGDALFDAPTFSGYTFGGFYTEEAGGGSELINNNRKWNKSKTGYIDSDKKWIYTDDITLKAKWTQTVTLDENGGSADGSADVVLKATSASTPSAPTYAGHTVVGYYADDGGANLVMSTAGALSNYTGYVSGGKWVHSGATTLYAHWKCNTPSISFASATNTVTITIPNGTKVYYTTDGSAPDDDDTEYTEAFTIDADCTVKAIAIQSGCTDSEVASEDLTYTDTKAYVTYAAGVTLTSGSVPSDATGYTPGAKVTVLGNTGSMVYTGYTFRGWTSGDYFYKAGDKFTISENTTLTAVWDAGGGGSSCYEWAGTPRYWTTSKKFTIDSKLVIESDADTTKSAINTNAKVWGDSHTETVIAISGTGNYIQGYFNDASEISTLTISAANNSGTAGTNKKYLVLFCANSSFSSGVTGQLHAAPSYKDSQDDTKLVHEFTAPAGTKYFRVYRKLAADVGNYKCGGDTIGDGQTTRIFGIEVCTGGAANYTVSFDDGNTKPASVSDMPDDIVGVPTGKKIVLPTAPTASGYTFVGWYKEAGCENEWDFEADAVTKDVTLYAKWCTVAHDITWVVNGTEYTTGDPTTSTTDCDGIETMPTAPSALTCSDSFRGWSETNIYGEAVDTPPADLFTDAAGAPTINENKTFYAVFATQDDPDDDRTAEQMKENSFTSVFTSKAWADAGSLWTSGADGYQMSSGRGVNVTEATTGAYATTKSSYKGVKEVIVTYSTNATAGVGDITIEVGSTAMSGSAAVTKTGGTTDRTITYTPASADFLDGNVKITVTCTTNSLYIKSVQVIYSGYHDYRCICPSLTVTPKLVTASTPIFITSAASKTVRSQDSLQIVGSGLKKNATLSISSPASEFVLKSRTGGDLTTSATGTISAVGYIYYTPGVGDTDDGLDKNNNFTITDGINSETVSTALIGRHLPANFVIAAKSGGNWYALPADMSKSTPNVVPISVDDDDDPRTASTLLANAYGLYTQHDSIELAMRGCSNAPLHGNATGASGNTNIGKSGSTNIDNIQNNPGYIWFLTQTNTSITNPEDAKYIISTPNNTYPLKLYETPNPKKWGLYTYSSSVVTEMRILTWTCANPAAPTISGTTSYYAGDNISLTASHDGSNHDAMTTYTWYKGADWATASAASPVQAAATGSSGYTLTIASCTTDDAGTYWCEASNGTCTAHNSVGYAITVSEASCTPQTVVKTQIASTKTGTTTGYNSGEYAGDPVIATFEDSKIDGGYKLKSGSKLFVTLKKGNFVAGDDIKIVITKESDLTGTANELLIFYDASSPKLLTTLDAASANTYTYTLTASDITTLGSVKTIGVYRSSGDTENNPYVKSVEVEGCRDWMTCTAPTAVAAGSVTGTSATFTITDAENTLNYELYISTSSTTPTADATPTATSSSKTKTVTGLSGSTTYYYWVRSNCGGYKSSWVAGTPATFTTGTAYTVTYNGNGSTGGSVPTDATGYAEGDVVTVKTNSGSLVKSGGYTLVGWSTNATPSSGIFYPAGYKFTMGAGNVTLYAVWASGGASAYYYGSVSITAGALTPGSTGGHKGFFTNEGGTVATSSDISLSSTPSETGYYYESSTLTHTELSKSSNWNPSSTSKRTIRAFKFANNTSYTLALGSATATKITFYGKCGSASRILSVGGVEWTSNSTKETFEYHEFTKVGNFTGNVTIGSIDATSDNRGDFYGILVVTMADGGSSGYTVTFDKNGQGSFSQTINNVPSGSKIGAPIPAPTATGYEFEGWFTDDDCEAEDEWNFSTGTITADKTLYAKWTTCAPTISADPSGTSYNQDADATALSVTATGDDLEYQWYSNEENSNEDGTEIPGATSASYTPSTALVGTIYYYCIVTNDCGNVTSNVAAITVNDSKPNPTATWTIAAPTHGGKGFSFSVTAYKNDGETAWDGTLTTAMLSASEDVVLSGVTVSDNTISGTYGVKASATSPVTFYLELPSTETQAAATLSQDKEFTACSGTGVDGSTYKVPFLAKYSSSTSGKPSYYCESDYGYISSELGTSSVSLASEGYDDFDYYINSGRGSVLIFTKVDEVKKIQVYLNANSGPAKVTNVYTAASYSTALKDYTELTEKTDYTVTYTDEDSNTSIAKGKNGHVDIAFTTNIAEGTLVYVVLKEKAKYFGAKLTKGAGSGATIDTELAWSNSQSDGATVVKGEDDAEFTITASRSGAAATASLGEIRYSSSDTKIATVNATTGEVTIADKISFGEDEYKTTTIKATLVSSGCYKSASITYTLKVNKSTCTEAAGTIEITEDNGCVGKVMTLSGYEEGASIAWYKDGSAITPAATGTTYTATTSGSYTAVTTKDCARTSNSIVVTMSATATASKIVDSWYVKNGRRTPDIALVQTTGATSFTVKSGETTIWDEANSNTTGFGGCDFELKEDGIIYLHGTKSNGDAPSDLVAGNETITVTVSGCGGALSGLDIIIKKQAETLKPSVAFVVDGTTRAKGGTATSVSTAKTSERPLWTYLSSSFTLTGCNIYWSVDSKELREYYSQYDAIVVTDDPNTQTKGAGDVEYVKAFGTLVDVRPILTMEAYVGRYTDGGWHVYNATPTSPNPRQVEMKLECRNHEIFAGVSEASDNVRSVTINGDDYWYITIVDTTQSPYKGTTKDYKDLPALQGFDPSSFSDMLGIGTIKEDELQAGVERQEEPAARMMILGIQNNAMGALTNEGKLIIKNAISYLLKTNMEEVDDCSNYFTGEAGTTDWNTASNWSKNSVPDFTTKVRIMAPVVITKYQKVRAAQVDIVVDGTSSKKDGELNGHVTINPGGALVVGGTVNRAIAPHYGIDDLQPTTDEDIFIKADANNSAALILDNSSGLTGATVQMYSSSHWDGSSGSKVKYWSYVAVPIQEALIPDYFMGAFTYYYVEKDGWKKKWDGDYLYPFQAIGLSRDNPGTEHFWGPLVSTENRDIKLTKTSTGGGGENLIANSWTAPIQIANFDADDFGDANATVYIYNTGDEGAYAGTTIIDANTTNQGDFTAGQWLGIPIGVAKLKEYEGLKVIPAMQSFEVDMPAEAADGTETTLHLDYDRLVRGVDISKDTLTEKLHAPKRRMSKNDGDVEAVMKVRVAGIHTLAEVWLIQDGAFGEGFDNGWEAYYAPCDNRSPQLYAHSEIGNMGITAKPELEGTILGFAPSRDGADYTFSFYYRGDEELYLNDLLTETSTPITNEDTYAFTASENGDGSRFIISSNPYETPQIITGTEVVKEAQNEKVKKFIYNDKLYILYRGMIFDANGKLINRK